MRFITSLISITLCLYGVWDTGRAGLSRLYSNYSMMTGTLALADEAVNLNPADPQAYYARAVVLSGRDEFAEAAREYERAIASRPQDYFLWLALGRTRDQVDDEQGALVAFKEAVRLAPHYAQPRWQLGNLLLRAGRYDEAFAELRRAAQSDPELFPAVIDLAWGAYDGDAPAVERALRPETPADRLALARFFIKQGSTTEAIRLFRAAGDVSDQDRRALLDELIAAGRFNEAFEVWASGGHGGRVATITDGDFESETFLRGPGFGWQLNNIEALRVSLERGESRHGAQSMLLEFSGKSEPSSPIITQLVLVEPDTRYRLSFAVRTRELVTGGLPVVAIADASPGDKSTLAQSAPLPQDTSDWQDYAVEFNTSKTTSAIRIMVRRLNCTEVLCPIFGRVWLDDFALRKL
ncbi:MAG TPA: tetratricopeptide repeat protein [Pyrinomonadaceae bacterium]|nr:tetratricopeptide repeat protein [Pyrinomonadaceae bacterium]